MRLGLSPISIESTVFMLVNGCKLIYNPTVVGVLLVNLAIELGGPTL